MTLTKKQIQAIAYLNNKVGYRIDELGVEEVALSPSNSWPEVFEPLQLYYGLKERISDPYGLVQGDTDYCWMATCFTYVYEYDPIGMINAIINLYSNGHFNYKDCNIGNKLFKTPSINITKHFPIYLTHKKKDDIIEHYYDPDNPLSDKMINREYYVNLELKRNWTDQMLLQTIGENFHESKLFGTYHSHEKKNKHGSEEFPPYAGALLQKAIELWTSLGYKVAKLDIPGNIDPNEPGEWLVQLFSSRPDAVIFLVNSRDWQRGYDHHPIMTAPWPTHFIRVRDFYKRIGKEYKYSLPDDHFINTSNLFYYIEWWEYGKWKLFKRKCPDFVTVYGVLSIMH